MDIESSVKYVVVACGIVVLCFFLWAIYKDIMGLREEVSKLKMTSMENLDIIQKLKVKGDLEELKNSEDYEASDLESEASVDESDSEEDDDDEEDSDIEVSDIEASEFERIMRSGDLEMLSKLEELPEQEASELADTETVTVYPPDLPEEGKCSKIIKSGKNKGLMCKKVCKEGKDTCNIH